MLITLKIFTNFRTMTSNLQPKQINIKALFTFLQEKGSFNKSLNITAFCVIMTLLTIQIANAQKPVIGNNWDLVYEAEALKIYTRDNIQSNIDEVRVTVHLESSPESVAAVLSDVSNYSNWVYKCKNSRLVENVNDRALYFYAEYDFPYPASDRDLIVYSERWRNHENGEIYFHSVAAPDFLSEKKSVVRIKELESFWIISPNADGSSTVEYIVKTSVGGNIPDWIVNWGITTGPKNSMLSLAQQLQHPKGQYASNLKK